MSSVKKKMSVSQALLNKEEELAQAILELEAMQLKMLDLEEAHRASELECADKKPTDEWFTPSDVEYLRSKGVIPEILGKDLVVNKDHRGCVPGYYLTFRIERMKHHGQKYQYLVSFDSEHQVSHALPLGDKSIKVSSSSTSSSAVALTIEDAWEIFESYLEYSTGFNVSPKVATRLRSVLISGLRQPY
jgi:hypothetical protein